MYTRYNFLSNIFGEIKKEMDVNITEYIRRYFHSLSLISCNTRVGYFETLSPVIAFSTL
jgi:hypothetical protein